MKNKFIKLFATILIVGAMLMSFVACNNDTNQTTCDVNTTKYDIPKDLAVNIKIYNGEKLLITIDNDILKNTKQENIRMKTIHDRVDDLGNPYAQHYDRTYVAYSLASILKAKNLKISTFNDVSIKAVDGKIFNYDLISLENSYITIGQVVNGNFDIDKKSPRLIVDNTSDDHMCIIQKPISIIVSSIKK